MGRDAARLLLNGAGFFHQAHRAVDDCHALLEILDFTLPTTGAPAFAYYTLTHQPLFTSLLPFF